MPQRASASPVIAVSRPPRCAGSNPPWNRADPLPLSAGARHCWGSTLLPRPLEVAEQRGALRNRSRLG